MSSIRERAEKIAGFSLVAFHDNPDAVRKQIAADIEKALRQVSNRVCDECESDLSDGSGFCATCDAFTMPSDFSLRWVRRSEMDKAISNERERCAKIADERAAFNRRLARGRINDTVDSRVADLKLTRADEAEVIAKEIREEVEP